MSLARDVVLRDDASFDGTDIWQLETATLTLDFEPIPDVANLIVRFENRFETSNQRIYGHDSQGTPETDDDTYSRRSQRRTC